MSAASLRHRPERWVVLRWVVLPSWLLSLFLHASVIVPFALFTVRSDDVAGFPGDSARDVGIVMEQPGEGDDDEPAPGGQPLEMNQDPNPNPNPQAQAPAPEEVVGAAPPVALKLPSLREGSVIGPGPISPPMQLPVGRDLGKPGPGGGPVGIPGMPPGGTGKGVKFFDIADRKATRIVYVIDASGSMSDHSAFAVARAELLASIQGLTDGQQFQIIFYNDAVYPFALEGRKMDVYFATDINKNLAANFVRSQRPQLGTRHMLAMQEALKIKPDVIFFLTDAREPELTAEEIDRIKQRCASRTTIHTIEFGVGENINVDTFLKKLSRGTNGKAGYRDVLRFENAGAR